MTGQGQNDITIKLGLDDAGLPQPVQRVNAAIGSIGKAGEVSARQTAAAMRTLPAQFTDIATQLAGGQNPLLILLQQGGQIKDSFGGVGAAIKGLGSIITPTAVLAGGLGVALGGLALAAYSGAKDAAALRDTLILTGNAAGLTASAVDSLAVGISNSTGQTVGDARELAVALAATGRTSSAVLEGQGLAIARLADLSGESGKKIAATFAGQLDAPAKFAAKLNEQYNFLNLAQFKRIQQLEQEGRATEAVNLTNDLLSKALESQRTQLGLIETALEIAAKSWSRFWQAALNVGKPDTLKQQLSGVVTEIQELQNRLAGTDPNALVRTPGGVRNAAEELRQRIADRQRRAFELQRAVDTEQLNADARSGAARTARAGIADALGGDGSGGRRDNGKPYIPAEFQVYDARDAAVLAARREKEESENRAFFERQLQAQDDRDEQLRKKNADFLQGLLDANDRAGVELLSDERARGEALIALERSIAQRRLQEMGLSGDARAEAERLLDEKALLSSRRLSQDLSKAADATAARAGEATYSDVRSALSAAFQDTKSPITAFSQALGNAVFTRVSAALADAAASGLVGTNGRGGILGTLLGLFSYSGTSTNPSAPNYENSFDLMNTPKLATGTNYVPRNMLAVLHEGEAVVPKRYNPAAGGRSGAQGVVYSPQTTYMVDSRTDREDIMRMMVESGQRQQREMVEFLQARGVMVAA